MSCRLFFLLLFAGLLAARTSVMAGTSLDISVNPAGSLDAGSYAGTNAAPSSFLITNSGTSPLSYEISVDVSWLDCTSSCSGTLAAGSTATIDVHYNNFSMEPGSYNGKITITDATSTPYEYGALLHISEVAAGSTCGEVPIYAQNLVDPAILVLLDVSSSMQREMPLVVNRDHTPKTPDLATVVHEVVNRSDWESGNNMAFIITGDSLNEGKRVAESYNGVSSAAPLLTINYTSGGVSGSIEKRVSQTNDDAEESSSGSINLTSTDLELVQEDSKQTVGIRFQDIDIPQGAEITSATIEFTIDEENSGTTKLEIRAEDSGNAKVFDDTITNDISTRTTTSASVSWSITDTWIPPPQKQRYIIGREVISKLVEDQTVSWGYGTWATSGYDGPGNEPVINNLPYPYGEGETALYTKIHAGVKHRDATETAVLKSLIEATTTTSGTPFGPSLLAAREYYIGTKSDEAGGKYDSTLGCQPKFLIVVTDGEGYWPHTSVDIVEAYTTLLAGEEISVVAVGFGIESATQITRLAEVANARGKTSTDIYALHEEDESGKGVPFIAMNQEDLDNALHSITNEIKRQIFTGSSPAPSSSVDSGSLVINASFNAADWTGDVSATPYDPATGALMICVDSSGAETCNSAHIAGKCFPSNPDITPQSCNVDKIVPGDCLCWTASEVMPAEKNAWTVAGTNSVSGSSVDTAIAGRYVDDHTSLSAYDIGLDGDNFICKDLGDIINSKPVIKRPPRSYYTFDNYRKFRFGPAKNREQMLYVGANDGALHAFNVDTGVESWRFYPEALHEKLIDTDTCAENYCHEYFVDSSPVVKDIYVGSPDTPSPYSGWRTILVNGLGGGGDAYFALDVTSSQPFAENNTNPLEATTYLWQFTDEELGLTMAEPVVARVNKPSEADYGGWMTFFGSGYDKDGSLYKEAYVYGIDSYSSESRWFDSDASTSFNRIKLEESDRIKYTDQSGDAFTVGQTVEATTSSASGVISKIENYGDSGTLILDTESITGTFIDKEPLKVGDTNIATVSSPLHSAYFNDALSDPLAADPDFDNIADYLYIGSMYGRLYKLSNIGKDQKPSKSLLFDIHPESINHSTPIRAGASMAYDSFPESIWLYFGTGKYETQADKFNWDQQYFIGLKDNKGSTLTDLNLSHLLKRTTVAVEATFDGNTEEYRIITGHSFVYETSSTLSTDLTMTGTKSMATGTIESLTTLDTKPVVTFAEADFPTNGVFIMGEEIVNDSNPDIRATLKNSSWYVRLQQAAGIPSERVVAKSLVAGGVVFFTTFIPDTDVCESNGSAWLYALDYETGLPPKDIVFDINGDGKYDDDDVLYHGGLHYPAGAIPIGSGKPSAPVLKDNMIFVNTTDARMSGIPVNLPKLKAKAAAWKDGSF